ncbi:MAG TPA: S8 family serine peptidase, partial [Candidatus Nanopelagicaceae bacterium]|nr:S8 family serine peptidase [Candidatus Nanopelagicaceae bacterium]
MEFNLNNVQFDLKSFPKWKEQISKADKNENGIDDNFEVRLKYLSEFGFIEENFDRDKEYLGRNYIDDEILKTDNQKTEKITIDDIPIIIYFPNGDYDSISLLFETLGGKIKSTYKAALNGFAGRISYNPLNEFCDLLIQNEIPFFIEEDTVYEAQLYYAGRNMNLRPYVWNNLSYNGDEYSSIAIIDTGIDDSHNFTSPGYSDADFNYKIVGWRDEVGISASPYDDNGHGSHCSGISAGEGNPNYDGTGRTVATAAYEWDYTGDDASPGSYLFNWARFNVTEPGLIELFCEFDDFTPGLDEVDFWAYLYYGETIVDSHEVSSDSWSHTLSFTATSSDLGLYSFRYSMTLIDNTTDGWVTDFNIRFRSEMHWPFSPNLFGSGDAWKGVAPDTRLVGVKVLDQHGSGWSSDIIDGINWVITNKNVYNITTMSLSLGGGAGDTAFINAVNNAVENGIVTVVSAGNDGPGGNNIGSPGDADNVITVAAMNIYDEVTDYSSQGGLS